MALDVDDPRIALPLSRLSPYARELLSRAGVHAARLHADLVTPDHLLSTLLDDPDSAACAVVLHAFADPKTISGEVLALSPGVMVVASNSTLPFSPLGLAALLRARARASETGTAEVGVEHVLYAALANLEPELRARLESAGLAAPPTPSSGGSPAFEPQEALFKHFSMAAKRALSAANRSAAALAQDAISPAHLVLGCLQTEAHLAETCGISSTRARMAFGDRTADKTPPSTQLLAADPALVAYIDNLPRDATSLDMLAEFLSSGTPELAQILARHKLSSALIDRSRAAFRDPPIAV